MGGGEHDWAYLLARLDLLPKDQALGRTVHLLGVGLFAVSVIWGVSAARAADPSPEAAPRS